jgi:myo-inositol-1-phosphate synthase
MKIDWLGQDSILAAPSVIDLARIVSLSAKKGNKGLLPDVSYFFKSPLTLRGKPIQHATPDQFNQLITYLKSNLTQHLK